MFFDQYLIAGASLAWMAYATLKNYLFQRYFRFSFNTDCIQVKNGFWILKTRIVQWKTIQCVEVFQGFYQQHHDYADLVFYTAGGKIVLPYIKLAEARLLETYVLYKVESSTEDWM